MQSHDISTLNASIIVKIGAIVLPVDNFDPDSDIFEVNDRQTAEGELTPDGHFNMWAVRSPIETSFTTTGASKAAKVLQGLLNAQANGMLHNAIVVVKNQNSITTYGPGVLTSAKPAPALASQKLKSITFNFKFGNVI